MYIINLSFDLEMEVINFQIKFFSLISIKKNVKINFSKNTKYIHFLTIIMFTQIKIKFFAI